MVLERRVLVTGGCADELVLVMSSKKTKESLLNQNLAPSVENKSSERDIQRKGAQAQWRALTRALTTIVSCLQATLPARRWGAQRALRALTAGC